MFDEHHKNAGRYKLFNDKSLRDTILNRLHLQLNRMGMVPAEAKLSLGLVCGHITEHNRNWLQSIFGPKGWRLYDARWLRYRFEQMAEGGYTNNSHAMIVKLVMNS